MRAVPSATVWINVGIGHLGEGAVHFLTIQQRCRAVSRGAHERMAKPDARAELDQTRCLRGHGGLMPDAEPTHGAPQQGVIAARLGRSREEHPSRRDRKRLEPPLEPLLDPPGERHRVGQPKPERQLRR